MALLFRPRINKNSINGLFNRLCKVPKYDNVQIAQITAKVNRPDRFRLPPFPYKKKQMDHFTMHFEYAPKRFDENSKLLVVEGPIASGKDKFARELAKQLDMAYMPPPCYDLCYQNCYGPDVRSLNHLLPESAQALDIQQLLCNPRHPNVAACQVTNLILKCNAHMEATLHILSTGEGVVMNRCFYSDYIFMNAMAKAGFVSQRCVQYYNAVKKNVQQLVRKPHVIIYLDVPVDIVQENIKKRCRSYEINSELVTKDYLTDIDNLYKTHYLPSMEDQSYVLMYDWSCGGDIEVVIDDIEQLKLEYNRVISTKMEQWTFVDDVDIAEYRVALDRERREHVLDQCNIPEYFDMPEFFLWGPDLDKYNEVIEKHNKYRQGYNPDEGDKVLFKSSYDFTTFKLPDVITNQELIAAS